jgi:hypothetical protein
MLKQLVASVSIIITATGTTFAAPIGSGEGDLVSKAVVELQCALLLSNITSDKTIDLEAETARLMRNAERDFRAGFSPLRDSLRSSEFGPLGPLMDSKSDDFWFGVYFQTAARDISDLLDRKAPIDSGIPIETRMQNLALAALDEFQRRNCRLIGKE